MPVVPDTINGRIAFYEAHLTPWSNNAVAIGLEAQQVLDLGVLVGAARDAYNAAVAAREASKAATLSLKNAIDAMHYGPGAGADIIRDIRNYAQSTDDPNVYALAQIPEPAEKAPAPAPGRPFDFEVGLLSTGAVNLRWKCINPGNVGGTIYEVMRKIGTGGEFEFIGSNGAKEFADVSLPNGATASEGGVTYQVTAVRSTLSGPPAQFTVNFGLGGSMTVSGTGDTQVKLAA